jgi:hypothetical protein
MYQARFEVHMKNRNVNVAMDFSVFAPVLAIRLFVGSDQSQVSDRFGIALRGSAWCPPSSHASGMAVRPQCLFTSHLRAYRNGTVGDATTSCIETRDVHNI